MPYQPIENYGIIGNMRMPSRQALKARRLAISLKRSLIWRSLAPLTTSTLRSMALPNARKGSVRPREDQAGATTDGESASARRYVLICVQMRQPLSETRESSAWDLSRVYGAVGIEKRPGQKAKASLSYGAASFSRSQSVARCSVIDIAWVLLSERRC